MNALYQVQLPYATFGIEINPIGIICKAAPIGKWMLWRHKEEVEQWIVNKQGKLVKVEG